jgi:imidazolonepropionase-like amidohydrolase
LAVPLDREKLNELADSLARKGAWTVPTLVERERAVARAGELDRLRASPQAALIPSSALEHWIEQVEQASTRLEEDDWALLAQGRANRLAVVAALHRGGAGLLAGTDTPNAFVFPGASLHDELALLVEAGLRPGEALLTATRDPARFLGRGDQLGTVEVGREADLVLLSGNPLRDIANTRSIRGVMRNGIWHSEGELAGFARALASRPHAASR